MTNRITARDLIKATRSDEGPLRVVSVDLGQANDYTAIIALEAGPDAEAEGIDLGPVWETKYIERVPLKTAYPAIVAHLRDIVDLLRAPTDPMAGLAISLGLGAALKSPPIFPRVALVIDYTGVGRPVLDMVLAAEFPVDVIPITITAGSQVHWDSSYGVNVPKRDLASTVQRLLQEKRVKFPRSHPMTPTLTDELTSFKVKISASGRDSYAAGETWRDSAHDDLVLALAMGLWYGELIWES